MKNKFLILLIPIIISCEFSSSKNYDVVKYPKIGSEVINKKNDKFGLKEGSKAQKLNSKGVDLGLLHKYEEAEKILKKALMEEPQNPIILNNIGLTYYHRGIYNTAISYFNKALKQSDSTSTLATINLGLTYYHQMDYARAKRIMDYSLSKQNLDNTEKLLVRLNRLMLNIEIEDCEEIKMDRLEIEYLRFNNETGDYPEQIEEFDTQIAKLCTTTVHRQ